MLPRLEGTKHDTLRLIGEWLPVSVDDNVRCGQNESTGS